jgi:hypothetical protein
MVNMALCDVAVPTEQKLEAMDWRFGGKHCRSVTFVDDVAGSIAGEEFEIIVIDGENENQVTREFLEKSYLVYLDDGVVSAPTPAAGQTLVAVSYNQDDDAATIAAAFAAELANAEVEVKTLIEASNPAKVEYQNLFIGAISTEDTSGASSLTFEAGVEGFGGYLGQIASGGATLEISDEVITVTSDNTGSVILDEIQVGVTNTLSLTLAEMTTARYEQIVARGAGDKVEVGDDKIIGYGTSKLYQSKFSLGGQLIGHPIRLPLSDRSADISMFTSPKLSSINFSGTELQGAECEFIAYEDRSVSNKVSLARRGDYTLL